MSIPDMPQHSSSISGKGARTRTRLLHAARQLAGQVGLAHLNVQMICQTAQVGRTSFYTYFPDAQAVIDTLASDTTATFTARFNSAHSDMPRGLARLERCLTETLSYAIDDPESARFIAALAQASDWVKTMVFQEILAELTAANHPGGRELAEFLTLALIALFADFANENRSVDQIPYMVAYLMAPT